VLVEIHSEGVPRLNEDKLGEHRRREGFGGLTSPRIGTVGGRSSFPPRLAIPLVWLGLGIGLSRSAAGDARTDLALWGRSVGLWGSCLG
jgi:hypothetical protein